jgi:diaminopimelate epimerase
VTSDPVALPFAKGHGTGNDFVLLPDHDGSRYGERVPAPLVAALCDRRRGIGADGVIRVVRAGSPGLPDAPGASWFMDYVNADGTIAEMCGNGVRVLVRYLLEEGLAADDGDGVPVGTRAGVLAVRPAPEHTLTVDMGPARNGLSGATVTSSHPAVTSPGTAVAMPNPHAVLPVESLDAVGALDRAPEVQPAGLFPDGVNVEMVERRGPAALRMRVHERGVGETLSCGTGVCAAAWVAMREDQAPAGTTYTVDVPGGRLWVTEDDMGSLHLRGPAVVVARGEISTSGL